MALRLSIFLFTLISWSTSAQNPSQNVADQRRMIELAEQIGRDDIDAAGARAFAAPINRQQQGNSLNSVVVNGEHKPFIKIHYRDGIQKAIFDETQRRVPPDFEDNNDVGGREFDAYEDNRLIDPRNEAPLFIPFLYRNESEEEASSTQAPLRTNRPLVAPELLQSRQPILVRTTTQSPFGRPTPAIRPAQPFGRPPPPPPQQFVPQQPRPQFPQQQGFQQSQQQRPPPPQQPFFPQQPQQPFRPQQPQPQFPQQSQFPPQQPRPQPPQLPRPSPPPQQPQLPRPQQPPPPPPSGPAANLRTGVCRHTIFYTPQEPNAFDIQRTYTHFAVVVSVDQCARTCHEFNCDAAILDPRTRHCQFNPSIQFRLPQSCPQWPNPFYRNNVQLGDELIKIQCVTCQQRRRGNRPAGAQQLPQLPAPLPPASGIGQQQQSVSLRRPSQPQFVLRTTTRERIGNADLNGNNLNASPIQRVANAAKTKNFGESAASFNEDEPHGEDERNLSEEFHKLERLLKSAEDYLDESAGVRGKGRRQRGKGREVPSWREGHPQGDGFSPLKINPLRRPFSTDNFQPQPIFYSTDALQRRRQEEEELVQRRTQKRAAEETEEPIEESVAAADPKTEGQKPKLNSAGSVKLQHQEPAGLRELPGEIATEEKSAK